MPQVSHIEIVEEKIYFYYIKIGISDKNKKLYKFLEEENTKCERIWKIYFTFVMPGYCMNMAGVSLASILFSISMNGHFVREFVFVPYNFV